MATNTRPTLQCWRKPEGFLHSESSHWSCCHHDLRPKPSCSETKGEASGCVPSATFDRKHTQDSLYSGCHLPVPLSCFLSKMRNHYNNSCFMGVSEGKVYKLVNTKQMPVSLYISIFDTVIKFLAKRLGKSTH